MEKCCFCIFKNRIKTDDPCAVCILSHSNTMDKIKLFELIRILQSFPNQNMEISLSDDLGLILEELYQ